jgi:hypothetical protein
MRELSRAEYCVNEVVQTGTLGGLNVCIEMVSMADQMVNIKRSCLVQRMRE